MFIRSRKMQLSFDLITLFYYFKVDLAYYSQTSAVVFSEVVYAQGESLHKNNCTRLDEGTHTIGSTNLYQVSLKATPKTEKQR